VAGVSNSVNTNSALYSALGSLALARAEVQQAEKRIQTGQRVADASDDAAVFSVSQQLRADVESWDEVARAQGPGKGIVEVADKGLTQISDLLNRLRSVALAHSAATGQQATIYANAANSILSQIDGIANTAKFNGITPLNKADIGSSPAQGSTSVPLSTGAVNSGGGLGLSTTNYPLPAQSGTVVLRYDAYSAPDGFALIYNGGTVATTGGLVSGSGTLTFPYGGGAPNNIDVQVNGGSVGTAWTYTLEFVTPPLPGPPTPDPEGSIKVIADITGNQTSIRSIDATSTGLGLQPWSISSAATALAAIDYAANLVAKHAGYYAERGRQIGSVKKVAIETMDAYVTGLGAIVDADIGREQARAMAGKVKTDLAIQSVGVANAAQRAILGFLERTR
jgi:flagellin